MASDNKTHSVNGPVAWLMDERLPRDRYAVVHRMVAMLKSKHKIVFLPEKMTEDELLEHIQKTNYSLVVLPWHKYFAWSKIDGAFGTLRMGGSTVAGYFADPILPYELSEVPNFHRGILLDCLRLNQGEVSTLLSMLTDPQLRAGIAFPLGKSATIFRDTWRTFDAAGPGMLDGVLNIPFFHRNPWSQRRHSLRLCANLLWSMIYDVGPGKSDLFNTAGDTEEERGSFEVGTNGEMLAMRLIYTAPDKAPKDFLKGFWPDLNRATDIQQVLAKQTDFLKVHVFPETNRVEIALFFLKSAPSRAFPTEIRGFWVEPLSEKYSKEVSDATIVPINRASSKLIGPALPTAPMSALDPTLLIRQLHDIDFATCEYCVQLEEQIRDLDQRKADSPEAQILRHKLMALKQKQYAWRIKYKELLAEFTSTEQTEIKKAS